ncbi:hypothetical protein [Deinococcus radiotolerans]|uniref:Uncharacterized protein n=1 Tax=Deinococcus radiotolerans TaxID=1309407 RepID=A0ABQ2FPV4_9DEIO|nr:hypothetical protein [Deinococcus radiotolerans]GGL15207.1 hypothetical protein GCM10010844_37490 [Deinococcus radiotolerans]
MTKANGSGNVVVCLSGAWRGEATDPQRSFHGDVVVSTLEALPVGAAVEVTYRDSGRRVTGPGEHGTYTLRSGDHTWTLSRFTQHASHAGESRDDRTPATEWEAELVHH